jgi:hypothetical protein
LAFTFDIVMLLSTWATSAWLRNASAKRTRVGRLPHGTIGYAR